jgi:hypothetical protein
MALYKHKAEILLVSIDDAKSCREQFPPVFRLLLARQCLDEHAKCKLVQLVVIISFKAIFINKTHLVFAQFHQTQISPSNAAMLRIPTPPPTNVDATDAAVAVNTSAIRTPPGSTPAAVIGLKLIGATVPNDVAGNRGGSGTTQKNANANTQKGRGCFIQLNPLVTAQKSKNANNQKVLKQLSQLNPLVELRLQPACSTCRA